MSASTDATKLSTDDATKLSVWVGTWQLCPVSQRALQGMQQRKHLVLCRPAIECVRICISVICSRDRASTIFFCSSSNCFLVSASMPDEEKGRREGGKEGGEDRKDEKPYNPHSI